MPNPHDQLIATAAKTMLGPLGFRRRGRSRTWIVDNGWWLNVVEFQPSGWAKGSFLNVNAHCLWVEQDYISYQYGGRVEPFTEYKSEDQFAAEATRLAQAAATAARELSQVFQSFDTAARALVAKENGLPEQARGSWPAYHAGMAMGMSGKADSAAALFRSIRDERVRSAVSRVERFVSDPIEFRSEAEVLIAIHRESLGVGPVR